VILKTTLFDREEKMLNKIISSKYALSASAFAVFFVLMICYETLKDLIFHDLTQFESHAVTVIFSSTLAAIISWFVYDKISAFQARLNQTEERMKTYRSAMYATEHYLNNMMNMFQLIEFEHKENGLISPNTIKMLREEMNKTNTSVRDLCRLEDPTVENVASHVKQSLNV